MTETAPEAQPEPDRTPDRAYALIAHHQNVAAQAIRLAHRILDRVWEHGHPGYDAVRTHWLRAELLDEWRTDLTQAERELHAGPHSAGPQKAADGDEPWPNPDPAIMQAAWDALVEGRAQ